MGSRKKGILLIEGQGPQHSVDLHNAVLWQKCKCWCFHNRGTFLFRSISTGSTKPNTCQDRGTGSIRHISSPQLLHRIGTGAPFSLPTSGTSLTSYEDRYLHDLRATPHSLLPAKPQVGLAHGDGSASSGGVPILQLRFHRTVCRLV